MKTVERELRGFESHSLRQIAVEQGAGYGTALMAHMQELIGRNGHSCIGNTHCDSFELYEKCGFTLVPGLVERFVSINEHEQRAPQDNWAQDAMFVADPAQHLAALLSSGEEIVIRGPLW